MSRQRALEMEMGLGLELEMGSRREPGLATEKLPEQAPGLCRW